MEIHFHVAFLHLPPCPTFPMGVAWTLWWCSVCSSGRPAPSDRRGLPLTLPMHPCYTHTSTTPQDLLRAQTKEEAEEILKYKVMDLPGIQVCRCAGWAQPRNEAGVWDPGLCCIPWPAAFLHSMSWLRGRAPLGAILTVGEGRLLSVLVAAIRPVVLEVQWKLR